MGTLSHHPCNSLSTSGQAYRKYFLLWKFRKCGNRPVVPLPFCSVGFSLRQRNATARSTILATQRHIVLFAVAVSSVGARHAVPERATRAPDRTTHCVLWSRESLSPPSESKPANTNIASIGATNTLGDKTMHLAASPCRIRCLQFSRAALVAACTFLILPIPVPSPRKK